MLFIFAGDDKEAHNVADFLELDRKRWRNVYDGHELQGWGSPTAKLMLAGNYFKNPRYHEVLDIAHACRIFVTQLTDRRP